MKKMKVKVVARKGRLVFIPIEPEAGISSKSWVPCGDDNAGPVVIGNTEHTVGMSAEAYKLMEKIKRNRDAVGDIMWDEDAFAWWGSNYRVMNPATAQGSRDFQIRKFTPIDNNQLTDFEKRSVDHAIKLNLTGWRWPHALNQKKPWPNSVKYGKFTTPYHTGIVYIASPYSDEDKTVVAERVKAAGLVAAKLVAKEVHAISPVVYGTTLMEYGPMKEDDSWKSWQHFCNSMIDISEAVYILKIPGWDTSLGVSGEKLRAATRGIECFLIDPDTLELEKLPGKLPLYKMSKKDVESVAAAYGVKYSHHDSFKNREDVYSTKNIRIMIYSNNGPAALAITAKGEIVEPLMGTLDNILHDIAKKMPEDDPRKKEILERYEKKVAGDAAAKPILDKYLIV